MAKSGGSTTHTRGGGGKVTIRSGDSGTKGGGGKITIKSA